MKVLVLYGHNYPDGMAMSNRLHLYSKGLIEKGCNLLIGVFRPKNKNSAGKLKQITINDGVPFYYILPNIESDNPIVIRLNRIFDLFFILKHIYLKRKTFDVLWCISMGWFTLFAISLLCKLVGKIIIIEVNEKPYSFFGNRLESEFFQKIKRFILLRLVYKNIDGFIVISENIKELIQKQNIGNSKILKIPILIKKNGFERSLKTEDHFIFHAGTLDDKKDGIINIFQAVAKAKKESSIKFKFILTKKYAAPKIQKRIDKIIEENDLQQIVINTGYLQQEELEIFMKTCTLSIINRAPNEQNLYNFSTKIGEYMSYGIPIISTSTGEVGNYLTHNENSLIINTENISQISNAILYLLNNPQKALELGEAGKKTSEKHFNYQVHGKRLYDFLNKLLDTK